MEMRYTYISAWSVVGGVSLPHDCSTIELFCNDTSKFLLTCEPDDYLASLDRGLAIGLLMLRGLVGQGESSEFDDRLNAELDGLREERKKKIGNTAVLVFTATGEIQAPVAGPSREYKDFIITFDAVDKVSLRRKHRADVQAMKLALALEGNSGSKFSSLADGVYLTDESNRIIYSFSPSFGLADVFVFAGLTQEIQSRVSNRYRALRRDSSLEQVHRLFSEMSDRDNDRLRVFLSGWAAFEILISKTFKIYEQEFLSPLRGAGQPNLRDRFLKQLRDVMKGKYRLMDKFLVVSSVLFPDADDTTVEQDYQHFKKLKELRDAIYHGNEVSEKDLPVTELSMLLRKYISAHATTFDKQEAVGA